MSNRLKGLILLNIVLLAGILVSLRSNSPSNTLKTPIKEFAVQDTAAVEQIQIGEAYFEVQGGQWVLNNRHPVQPNMIRSLLAVLNRLEVKRPAPELEKANLQAAMQTGTTVTVNSGPSVVQSFTVILGSQGQTYAQKDDGNIYEVFIPGYNIEVYNLLQIDEQEWRDRRVLLTSWRTLQSLEMEYYEDDANSFKIEFDSIFYRIPGVQRLDSAKVYAFIQQFQDFNVAGYINDPVMLKRLEEQAPFLTIRLRDMVPNRDNELEIFPAEQEILYGINKNSQEVVAIERRMLNRFLVARSEFEQSE